MVKRRTFQPKSRSQPNTLRQSYNHMQGNINDPADHPAYNMPDPAGRNLTAAAPSAPSPFPYQEED